MLVSVAHPGRPYAELSDLTPKEILRRGWEDDSEGQEQYVVQFAVNLTADEATAIRRRMMTTDAADEQRLLDLIAAVPTTEVERLWRETELARYGEVPPPVPTTVTTPSKGKPATTPNKP